MDNVNKFEKLECACAERRELIDRCLAGAEREQEALVAAIGALLDEHFQLHHPFKGVGQISAPLTYH